MRKAGTIILLSLLILSGCEYFIDPGIQIEPKLYLFAIGIGYEHSPINDLDYTKADAAALSSQIAYLLEGKMDYEIALLMDEEEGFTLSAVDAANGIMEKAVLGKEAISIERLSEIMMSQAFSNAPEDEDIIIFYYAGHGKDETGDLVYTYDYGDAENYEVISVRTLFDSLMAEMKGRKLIMLDSCYSGNFIEDGDLAELKSYDEEGTLINTGIGAAVSLAYRSLGGKNSAKPDCYVISAASKDQAAYEAKEFGHGYFTYAILEYLGYDTQNSEPCYTSKFDSSVITVSDLYQGIVENHPAAGMIKYDTPCITPSRYDMAVFSFR